MRTARVVGLSQDGRSLIVAGEGGEELAIPCDERLRAAMRGDRPRLGQLEIDMDSALTPRDIQARIRSGESLEDVARVAGMPADRVERFAAPVLAEREHVAAQALASSVRRRGETSGHRNLRITLTERLHARGVDIDTLSWDSYRMEDGRWAVTADYRSGEAPHRAVFFFDLQGRFSIAGNDEARWVLGEQSPARGPQPGRRPRAGGDSDAGDSSEDDGVDAEPTLDLSDDLAIVRAVQEPPPAPRAARPEAERADSGRSESGRSESGQLASVQALRPPPPVPAPEASAPAPAAPPSPLDTLDDLLDADYSEDSVRIYAGLSDASAVPEHAERRGAGWEPAIVVNYPVEPSGPASSQGSPADATAVSSGSGSTEESRGGTDEPGAPDEPTGIHDREDEAEALEEEHEEHVAPTARAEPAPKGRRRRAAVPSWDEIMFGSPSKP